MGTFFWRGICDRVPMVQLARSREEGVLKLQLPALKCKSLAVNRHLREIESIPYYRSLIHHANPSPVTPADLPDLRQILSSLSQIPHQLQQNPSADQIHRHFVQQTDLPRVERNNPANDWPRSWRNIAVKQLSSMHRSELYLWVNEKIEHRRLMFVMQRVPDEYCTYCGNQTVENLCHKFSTCARVVPAWTALQQRLTGVTGGWRRLSFEDMLRPALRGLGKMTRTEVLNLFIKYMVFINGSTDGIDVAELIVNLDL